ncbi:outer membrane efflux protein [hydrothermal vent metagenome]|uniref:Outer membrane efflux protein n=1 Tax=hydrothermal vent metagenome TaxID=652676 RepID=A0A1W1E2I2_9ZZZZ
MKSILVSLLFFAFNAQAITEQAFVERLKSVHPFFKQQVTSSAIKKVEKQATTANEDWIIAVDSTYQSEANTKNTSATNDRLNTTSIGISTTKKYTDTGSNLTIKHTWADKNKDIDAVSNQFSIDYTYPLLRNKAGINDRLNFDVAQIAIAKNNLERLEAEENFILKQLTRFVALAYAQQQQLINEHRLALAKKELTLVTEKYNASVVEKVDVLLQKDAYQKAKQQLLQAQQELTLLRHEIAITLGIDFEKIVAEIDLYKTYQPKIIALQNYLTQNSRVLKTNDLAKTTLKRQLRSFKNQSKSQLDLNLGLSSAGEDNHYSNSLSNQDTTWKVGLGFSYPLGGTQSTSNIQKANMQLLNLAQSKQQQLLELYIQAETLKEKIQLLKEILDSNKVQIDIAKARTKEEKQRYTNGNGQASFVINAQNNEQIVQLNYVKTAKDYQQAVLEFKASIDQLHP